VVIAGTTPSDRGTGNLGQDAYGDWDGLVARYSPEGELLWQRRIGGAGTDHIWGMKVRNGQIWTIGQTRSGVEGTRVAPGLGNWDYWLTQLSISDGSVVRDYTMASSNEEYGYGLTIGEDGQLVVTGGGRPPQPGSANDPWNSLDFRTYAYDLDYAPKGYPYVVANGRVLRPGTNTVVAHADITYDSSFRNALIFHTTNGVVPSLESSRYTGTFAFDSFTRSRQIPNPNTNQVFTMSRYEVVREAGSWHEAKAKAEARGGHLVTLVDETEYDEMVRQLGSEPEGAWIGATDEALEGNWRWITDEPWGYSRWSGGEPNNAGGGQHYAYIWGNGANGKSGRGWDDLTACCVGAFIVEYDDWNPPFITRTTYSTNRIELRALAFSESGLEWVNSLSA
jgi:hypothetical protein